MSLTARCRLGTQLSDGSYSEPSASLDPKAEQALFKRVHALSSGEDGKRTTTIFISHRIQTVRRADKIIVVENGVSRSHFTSGCKPKLMSPPSCLDHYRKWIS